MRGRDFFCFGIWEFRIIGKQISGIKVKVSRFRIREFRVCAFRVCALKVGWIKVCGSCIAAIKSCRFFVYDVWFCRFKICIFKAPRLNVCQLWIYGLMVLENMYFSDICFSMLENKEKYVSLCRKRGFVLAFSVLS